MASRYSRVNSGKNDRPVPISPNKTVNVYVLIGLVRMSNDPGLATGNSYPGFACTIARAPPSQVITWFLIIDIMILTYLNNRG